MSGGPVEEDGDYAREFFGQYKREADRIEREPAIPGLTLKESDDLGRRYRPVRR